MTDKTKCRFYLLKDSRCKIDGVRCDFDRHPIKDKWTCRQLRLSNEKKSKEKQKSKND